MIPQPLISEEGFFSTTKRQFQLKYAQQATLAAPKLGFHWEHSMNSSFCKVWGQKSASLRPNSDLKLSNEFGFFHNCTWDGMGKLCSASSLACDPTPTRLDLPAFQYFQHEQNQKQEYWEIMDQNQNLQILLHYRRRNRGNFFFWVQLPKSTEDKKVRKGLK